MKKQNIILFGIVLLIAIINQGSKAEDYTFTIDGVKVTPSEEIVSGKTRLVITKSGISSRDLDTTYEFKVNGKDGKSEMVRCSAMSYGYSALSTYAENTSKKALCDMMSTMYLHHEAAEEYFK